MSVDLHVLFNRSRMPTNEAMQQAIDRLCPDLKLDASIPLDQHAGGYLPMSHAGESSGFELSFGDSSDLVESYPALETHAATRDRAANFYLGGDDRELLCAIVFSWALARITGGAWFDPQEGEDAVYEDAALEEHMLEVLDDIAGE